MQFLKVCFPRGLGTHEALATHSAGAEIHFCPAEVPLHAVLGEGQPLRGRVSHDPQPGGDASACVAAAAAYDMFEYVIYIYIYIYIYMYIHISVYIYIYMYICISAPESSKPLCKHLLMAPLPVEN